MGIADYVTENGITVDLKTVFDSTVFTNWADSWLEKRYSSKSKRNNLNRNKRYEQIRFNKYSRKISFKRQRRGRYVEY